MSINLELFKNPVIIGIAAGALTYAYMYWENEQKYKKKPTSRKKPVSFVPPAVVAVIVWFIASSYFDSVQPITIVDQQVLQTPPTTLQVPNTQIPTPMEAQRPNNISSSGASRLATPVSVAPVLGRQFTNSNFPRPNLQFGGKSLDDLSVDSFGSKSYHLVSKGNISLPTTRNLSLPSTFIEMDATI